MTEGERFVEGRVVLLRVIDVADWVDVDRARQLAAERGATRGTTQIRGPERRPGGVVLATEPFDLELGPLQLDELQLEASVRLFDLGVASFRFASPLAAGTTVAALHRLAVRLQALSALDARARDLWKDLAATIGPALRGAHDVDLVEDYVLWELRSVDGCAGDADRALAALDPAALLLGEPERPVAPALVEGYRVRALRYLASDATVVSWSGAVVVDEGGARDELEVLEIATARLLELRYYDRLLGRELEALYGKAHAARETTALFRSPFADVALRAATLFVEMTELHDRAEGALTLVGDAYTARLYRDAEERFRLPEIDARVQEKLDTLAKVSGVLQGEVGHRRALALETAVVLLIVLEVVLGFLRAH